jgi:hypothetical protein
MDGVFDDLQYVGKRGYLRVRKMIQGREGSFDGDRSVRECPVMKSIVLLFGGPSRHTKRQEIHQPSFNR